MIMLMLSRIINWNIAYIELIGSLLEDTVMSEKYKGNLKGKKDVVN